MSINDFLPAQSATTPASDTQTRSSIPSFLLQRLLQERMCALFPGCCCHHINTYRNCTTQSDVLPSSPPLLLYLAWMKQSDISSMDGTNAKHGGPSPIPIQSVAPVHPLTLFLVANGRPSLSITQSLNHLSSHRRREASLTNDIMRLLQGFHWNNFGVRLISMDQSNPNGQSHGLYLSSSEQFTKQIMLQCTATNNSEEHSLIPVLGAHFNDPQLIDQGSLSKALEEDILKGIYLSISVVHHYT